MHTENYISLYSDNDKQILKDAEDSLNPKIDRLHEIVEYAQFAGVKTIGIGHCTALRKEADYVRTIFEENGIKVAQVDCKLGKIPFNNLIDGYKGLSCNPAGQAHYLSERKTELNVMMGLCVGHDMIFNQKSSAPVTALIVKDRKYKHKTIEVMKNSEN